MTDTYFIAVIHAGRSKAATTKISARLRNRVTATRWPRLKLARERALAHHISGRSSSSHSGQSGPNDKWLTRFPACSHGYPAVVRPPFQAEQQRCSDEQQQPGIDAQARRRGLGSRSLGRVAAIVDAR